MSDTIKPCPFCNKEVEIMHGGNWTIFVCRECKLTTEFNRPLDLSLEFWNHRTSIPPEVAATIRGALGNLRGLFNSTLHWWFGKPLLTKQAKNIARLQNEIDRIDAALAWLDEVTK